MYSSSKKLVRLYLSYFALIKIFISNLIWILFYSIHTFLFSLWGCVKLYEQSYIYYNLNRIYSLDIQLSLYAQLV